MASGTTNCPNCKNPITRTSTFCTVCGYVFSQTVPPPQRTFQQPQIGGQQPIYKGRQPVQPHTNPTAFVPNPTSGSPGSFSTKGLFGWWSVSGTVIDVSQPYQIRPQGSSLGCLISLLLLPARWSTTNSRTAPSASTTPKPRARRCTRSCQQMRSFGKRLGRLDSGSLWKISRLP